MLDVLLIILHALCVILILLKDLSLVEIETTLAELAVALLDVSVRSEEHQDATLDALVQFEEEAAKVKNVSVADEAKVAINSAKKESQKPKFDKVLAKIDDKKKEASKQFGLGSFGDAIKIYKAAAEILETLLEDFPLFKKEVAQSEAAIFNNIAFAYGRDSNEKMYSELTSALKTQREEVTGAMCSPRWCSWLGLCLGLKFRTRVGGTIAMATTIPITI